MYKVHGSTVIVSDGQFEKAMRKFKKRVQTSGILQELREKENYIKPTTRRKMKASAAKARWRKQLASQQLPGKNY